MKKSKKEKPADDILYRAYNIKISIAKLCRIAGVDRSWFERLKKRVPKSVEAYIKIDEALKQLEDETE